MEAKISLYTILFISVGLNEHKYFLISGSTKAGDKLRSMLELGASKPWKEVHEIMTDEKEMNTDAFREYFLPLEKWLEQENMKNNVTVGWSINDFNTICKRYDECSS